MVTFGNEEKVVAGAIITPIICSLIENEIAKRNFNFAGVDGKTLLALGEVVGGYYTYKKTDNPILAGAGIGAVASGAKTLGEFIAKKLFETPAATTTSRGLVISNNMGSQYYYGAGVERKTLMGENRVFTV